jgi:SH3 domain-containing YSC84-like protein 1
MQTTLGRWLAGGLIGLALAGAVPAPARGDDLRDAEQLTERARLTLENFVAEPDMAGMLTLLKRAKGILIYPSVLRGAFIFGASGGSGTFLVRDERVGTWTGPAFYTIGEASFGLQIGGEASEIILLALTDRGVNAFLNTSAKLGADANLAVGPIGRGASASTQNLSADVVSYARSKGLYGGVSLQGAIVAVRDSLNHAYYGQPVSPADILLRPTVKNPQAAPLIEAVKKATSNP